ncbi:MAG: glycosyltransferase family 4 protein [Bacteroidales bacterium]|jgi:glycosyltransferase involved in cell wall biosynthesis|nr:glycosyltransferase family 4 protein [Bacteroidales bacterium]
MKLLILTQYFPPEVGAPQSRLYEVAQRLHKKGIQVSVLTAMPNYPQMRIHEAYKGKCFCKEDMDGMKIYRSWIYVPKSKALFKRLINYFSFVFSSVWCGLFRVKGKYDVLLVESPPLFLGISAVILSRFKKAKLVFNVSDLWPESAEKLGLITNKTLLGLATRLEEYCYRKSAMISGQTQGIVNNIKSRFPQKKVHWLKNGVDINYYDVKKDFTKGSWRQEHGFAQSDFLLFFGGILGYAQDIEVILRCAASVKEYGDIKFVIYGTGPEKERLIKMKEDLKADNVSFYPAVAKNQMQEIIMDMDCSMAPLKRIELFKGAIPTKIFENLALKKPLLLGVDGEARELFVNEGKCCLFFEPENEEAMKEQLLRLYNDRNLLNQLGENGLDYVTKYFNRDIIAEDFRKALLEII